VKEKIAFSLVLLFLVTITFFVGVCSALTVDVEFLYFKPPYCPTCPEASQYEVYLNNSKLMQRIRQDYGEKVNVQWIYFFSKEGTVKRNEYNLSFLDINSIIINHEIVFRGGSQSINETQVREVIDFYLGISQSPPEVDGSSSSLNNSSFSMTFLGTLMIAFSLGFIETFSPCLIILLSFILGYTLGDQRSFKQSFLKILVFGIGFVSASAILGLACAVFFFSVPSLQYLLTWIVCVFAVIFSLNLLGILRFQIQTKPLIRKFIEKYGLTLLGIFLLGFVFYFLDPCIAPIFVAIVPILFSDIFLLILLVFCLGAIIPFIVIGIFVGSISKLTRSIYRHKVVFRGASGIILMCYALYLIFFYLL
jgi:cytochrome c biogenesis protein CcdA